MENKKDDEKKAQANPLQAINDVIAELEKDPELTKEVEALHKVFIKVSNKMKNTNGR